MSRTSVNDRANAAKIIAGVLHKGRSLSGVRFQGHNPAWIQALVYGVLRHYWALRPCLDQCLDKPLRLPKESNLEALLLVGLYQLKAMRLPPHAAVSETVTAAAAIGRKHALGLVNAVLRKAIRENLLTDPAPTHPEWIIDLLRQDWPEHWQDILAANDAHPPMWLRVNTREQSRADYLDTLSTAGLDATPADLALQAVRLSAPCDVTELPGFAQGSVSVQDAAAQLAEPLLALEPGMRVLDACAAPGGKTCHIMEANPKVDLLVAVDSDKSRLERVTENLLRLGLHGVQTKHTDMASKWWKGTAFDRILLDAPCSASGVIRRHPDIKVLRKSEDIDQMVELQRKLLDSAWSLLSSGGVLVYATCSVFRRENEQQIQAFVRRHPDARPEDMGSGDYGWGHACPVGRQILPGQAAMDGFYYACLQKV